MFVVVSSFLGGGGIEMKWQPTVVDQADVVIQNELSPVLDSHQTYVLSRYYKFCEVNGFPFCLDYSHIVLMASQMLRHQLAHTTAAEHVEVLKHVADVQGNLFLAKALRELAKRIKFRGRFDGERPRAQLSTQEVRDTISRLPPDAASNAEMMAVLGFRNGDLRDLHANHIHLEKEGILFRFVGGKTSRSRRQMKVLQVPYGSISKRLRKRLEKCKRQGGRFTDLPTAKLSSMLKHAAPRPGVTSYALRDACFSGVLGQVLDPSLGLPDLRRAALFTGHRNPGSLKAYCRRVL